MSPELKHFLGLCKESARKLAPAPLWYKMNEGLMVELHEYITDKDRAISLQKEVIDAQVARLGEHYSD